MRQLRDFFLLPYVELYRHMVSTKHPLLRILTGTVMFPILIIVWVNAYFITGSFAYLYGMQVADQIGLVSSPVHIAGTGSMYPTFPKGSANSLYDQAREDVAAPLMRTYPGGLYLLNTWFNRYELRRGDIVSFANQKTTELISDEGLSSSEADGFVKRVIALPGDTVQIRNGFVYVNGEQLDEPYTASAKSTFGGQFLPDCTTLTVPERKVFVMGDNRKASNDSRHELGLVDENDISRVLPFQLQAPYSASWRDSSKDVDLTHSSLLNSDEYIDKLNAIRKDHGVKPLKHQPKLEQSAKLRAQAMLKYNDLSFEATRSGYTMEKALNEVGYSNIIWSEAPTLGYYTADELLENYAQFPAWEKFLLDKRYQDTGVATVVGEMNGCPVQIVVQHVAGYVPPNYKQADIESWKNAHDKLAEILPSWEKARTFGAQYEERKAEYEKIISLIKERIDITQTIYTRMAANQWLTDAEKKLVERDKELGTQQNQLAAKLNGR